MVRPKFLPELESVRIDFEERRVHLSVTEFAQFHTGPSAGVVRGGGRWRAEAGRRWHTALREQAEQQTADTGQNLACEVSLLAVWKAGGWELHFQGRVDQILVTDEAVCLREIKTVRHPLPVAPDELATRHPAYFQQAATYALLAPLAHPMEGRLLRAELIFVNIDDGLMQTVGVTEPEARFAATLDLFLGFLESHRTRRRAYREVSTKPAFESWRPGQMETRKRLAGTLERENLVFLEAPTGFGKTGVALELALERLRATQIDRILYLTGKSTGQLEVCRQLSAMRPDEGGFHYFQMRSLAEHGPFDPAWAEDARERWRAANLQPQSWFTEGTVTLEKVTELARTHQFPPHALSRSLLPWADVWVGDYNYVFSPRHASVFMDVPGFDPTRTLLIVDEAHNLPGRAADAWTLRFPAEALHLVVTELERENTHPRLIRALDDFIGEIERFPTGDTPAEEAVHGVSGSLTELVEILERHFPDPTHLSEPTMEWLWEILDYRRVRDAPEAPFVWARERGTVEFACLSAAPHIARQLLLFGQVVIMSATLGPAHILRENLGLDARAGTFVLAEAPWREGAYQLAIDPRVDTSLKGRRSDFPLTAETVLAFATHQSPPIAVFFPSYRYAEDVRVYAETLDTGFRIALPPRGLSLAEQRAFIEENLLLADALFLVLGSGFSEGIDLLGGRVEAAMVVSPALPEVNGLQEARRRELHHLDRDAAFERIYRLPAMMKINQALGRLVRAPGHRARILLHCRRFRDHAYTDLLDPAMGTPTLLPDTPTLHTWLSVQR
ncbi:MAG: PhoH family protein [Opitutales bacterium]|nr:PhoH family protein [Opitutales bacterium]